MNKNVNSAAPDSNSGITNLKIEFPIFTNIIQAVRDEIIEIQTSQNVRKLKLSDGKLVGVVGEVYRYRFILSDDFRTQIDSPIEITVGNYPETFNGTILLTEPDKFIEIGVEKNLGNIISDAVIAIRLDFIWKAVEKKLNQDIKTTQIILLRSLLNPKFDFCYDDQVVEEWGEHEPNHEQRTALLNGLANKVSFVHGPPGTGKSDTIGWLTKELLRRGEKVLIVSHTNIAVDNALERVLNTSEGKEIEISNGIIRLGQRKFPV